MASSTEQVVVHLKALSRRVGNVGAKAAATAMGDAFVEGVVDNELSRYVHARGTPTPSPAGEPPARISGSLARSVRADRAVHITRSRWSVTTGPRIVYGRIQELGGEAGPEKHRVTLPARPYLAPALARMRSELHDVGTAEFAAAIGL